MKNLLILLSFLFLFLTSCAPRISYTKEFPYLPSYKNMVAELEEKNEKQGQENEKQLSELQKVTYTIKNAELENVLTEYETILHKDGWKTTLDGKPNMLQLEKENHTALIIVYNQDNAVRLEVTSK